MSQNKEKFMEILAGYIDDEDQRDQTADFLINNLGEEDFDRQSFIESMKNPEDEDEDAWPDELISLVNQCFDHADSKKKKFSLKNLKTKITPKPDAQPTLSIEVKTKSPKKEKVKPMKIHNAYHMFGFEHRPKLQEKYDKKTENQTIEKELAKMWEETKKDPSELKKYQDLAKAHNEEAVKFNDEHGFETKRRSPNKSDTKGPVNRYTMFFTVKRQEVAEANPDMEAKEIMKKVGELWHELSEEEKDEWKTKAEEKNKAEGRVAKSSTKTASDKPKGKTDHYKMWVPIWKESYKSENPGASTDKIREAMKEAWKEVKKDKAQLKVYQEMAQKENEKRGFIIATD